jgi:hypothetical protein
MKQLDARRCQVLSKDRTISAVPYADYRLVPHPDMVPYNPLVHAMTSNVLGAV